MTLTLETAFIEGRRGRLFVLARLPKGGSPRGCVLFAPPFAEEMNKCRKMMTDLSTALANRGIASVIADLFGTGDSEGELSEADWSDWQDDLERAAEWGSAFGCPVDGLVGVRLGCMLAADAARRLGIERSVWWQPVLDGARVLDQFLRLRVAATMMEGQKESIADLRSRLAAGEALEVAGYELSGRLAGQIDGLRLAERFGPQLGETLWLETVRSAESSAPTPSVAAAERLRKAGVPVSLETVVCEPFWSTVEIVTNVALVNRSAEFLGSTPAGSRSGVRETGS